VQVTLAASLNCVLLVAHVTLFCWKLLSALEAPIGCAILTANGTPTPCDQALQAEFTP